MRLFLPILFFLLYLQANATFEAQKKFGSSKFNSEKFKTGNRKLKGEMAADLILKKSFIGKPLSSVQEVLGSPDGYFENDGIPAYIISADVSKKDTWQIIFYLTRTGKKLMK